MGLNFFITLFIVLMFVTLVGTTQKGREVVIISANGTRTRKKETFFVGMFIILFFTFLCAMRSPNIGNDTPYYYDIFKNISKSGITLNSRLEIGFQTYCFLLSKISSNPQILLIVSALIYYSIVTYYAFHYTDNEIESAVLIIALFFRTFNSGIRQDIAMSLCILSLLFLEKNKRFIAYIIVLIAASFHSTAIIFFLYFIIRKIRYRKGVFILALPIFCLALFSGSINIFIIGSFSKYGSYAGERAESIGFFGALLVLMKVLVFAVVDIYLNQKNRIRNDNLTKWLYAILFFLALANFRISNMSRMLWYFQLPAFNSTLVKVQKSDQLTNVTFSTVLLVFLLLSLIIELYFRPEYFSLIPYTFFWNY